MTAFLTFTLMAPLASFGGIAVGERRAGGDRPAKSAILGLVAGALGVEREDNASQMALARELFYAVRSEDMKSVRSPRRLMTDYHTAQSPPRGRNQRFKTRREEVADKQTLGTILSYREYRSDCAFTIGLWPRSSAMRFGLEDIAEALRKPAFVPYAGRKACPLMLPMRPLIIEAVNVRDAFIQRDGTCESQRTFLQDYHLAAEPRMLALDADADEETGHHRERRRDEIIDRSRWQFGMRDELVCAWDGGAA